MKLGLIARTEDRGLGNLTWEFAQHMHPDQVLVVVPNHAVTQRPERYPNATTLAWDHHRDSTLDEPTVRAWLARLAGGVVYSAETFYDWRVCDWAREAGVKTVCHVMPEYYRHGQPDPPPSPDAWWAPTRWRIDTLPEGTRLVPVPVAFERFPIPDTYYVPGNPIRWLHVAGARAAADRNGTRIVMAAIRALRGRHTIRIRSQDGRMTPPLRGRHVKVEIVTQPEREYWQLYGDADALLLPRRYAGLSLPAQEAMAAGLALVMPDVEPQSLEWPIVAGLPAKTRGVVRTAAGAVPLAETNPRDLAVLMDSMAEEPRRLYASRREAREWAIHHSWERLKPTIEAELTHVHVGVRP